MAMGSQLGELASWAVWRQDEHGNRFEVSRGHTRGEAERIVRELEAKGHKQTYRAAQVNA